MCNFTPVFKQFLTILCCNLLVLSFGTTNGWATINFNELQNANSTFTTGPINLEEASLVVSLVNIGGFIGNFAILPISQIIGIKRTLHVLGIVILLSTLCIIWAQNVYYLYASRLLSGFVYGAVVVGIPTLINEISYDSVRGALNSLFDPFNNIGIILSFFLGNYLSCLDQAKLQLIVPAIFLIVMFFIPETPEYWAKRNNAKRAIKAQHFYKGEMVAEQEKAEFLQQQPDAKVENGKSVEFNVQDSDSKLTLQDFLTPHAKRAFFIAFTSLSLSFISGAVTILSYVTDIFTKTGSSFSAKNSSLLISITQILANLVMLNIVERINRRTLYVCSSILASISFFFFAAYCLLWIQKPEYEWMPPFCFGCIIFSSCLGLLPIPYIITIEIFPKKIRQTCLAFAVSMMWVTLFILGSIFPTMLEMFGLFSCMVTLGLMCLLNAAFGVLFIPETRGKSCEEIAALLIK